MRRRTGRQRTSTAVVWGLLCLGAAAASAAPERLDLPLGGAAPPLSLVRVRAGRFIAGSPASETGRGEDEAAHAVTLTRDLYVGETPVLRAQFARFVEIAGYRSEAERGTSGGSGLVDGKLVQRPGFDWRQPGFAQGEDHPVVLVTWEDAQAFARWASTQTGYRVRLPTEAEWELACRAGTDTPYYGALDATGAAQLGWFGRPPLGTHPVRGTRPNGLQLHDLIGHVQQWTSDWYAPYSTADVTDPRVEAPPTGSDPARRVLRGGSFLRSVSAGRCGARSRSTPGSRNADIGFRVVVDSPPEGAVAPPPNTGSTGAKVSVVVPEPQSEGEGAGSWPWLIGGGAAVAALLWRRRRSTPQSPSEAAPVAPAGQPIWLEPLVDGFRLHARPSDEGRTVRYRVRLGGSLEEREVRIEHSAVGQLVYLGVEPIGLRLVSVSEPIGGSYESTDTDDDSDEARDERDDSDDDSSVPSTSSWSRSSGGDPPAY